MVQGLRIAAFDKKFFINLTFLTDNIIYFKKLTLCNGKEEKKAPM